MAPLSDTSIRNLSGTWEMASKIGQDQINRP
ncbi:hypothetical protein AARAC_001605 [Aspergillus arachidicola]|uniref:Uncharacterized protein n=1 Tax=Aspergillus arachidicola TaxID=656916 RepID=A0A2G7G5F5_9EURO|nr:hypothetical protein AARAC_001605 [Aspergillus arachidicola]